MKIKVLSFLLSKCLLTIFLIFICVSRSFCEDVDGLIIDQTLSKFGHDFYNNYYNSWEELKGVKNYNIVVVEDRSDPKIGTWVSIEINGVSVYRSLLKPKQDSIEESSLEAIELSRDFLLNMQEYEKNLMEEKDMKGDGLR